MSIIIFILAGIIVGLPLASWRAERGALVQSPKSKVHSPKPRWRALPGDLHAVVSK